MGGIRGKVSTKLVPDTLGVPLVCPSGPEQLQCNRQVGEGEVVWGLSPAFPASKAKPPFGPYGPYGLARFACGFACE